MTRDQRLHCAATFIMDGTAAAGFFAFPFLLMRLGATTQEMGLATSLRFGVYTLICLNTGRIARRFRLGTRVAVLGAAIWALGHFILPRCGSVWTAAACGTLASLGLAMFWPAIQAWTGATREQSHIIRRLVTFNVTWAVATALSPYFSGRLFDWRYQAPFYAAGVGALLAAAAVALLKPTGSPADGPDCMRQPAPLSDDARRALPFLMLAWLGTAFCYFMAGIQRDILPKLAAELGIGATTLGALMLVRQAGQTLMFWLPGRWGGWRFSWRWVLGLEALAIASFLLLSAARSPTYILIAYIPAGLSHGLMYFSSMYYSVVDPAQRERRIGFHEAMVGLGYFAGPAFAGTMAQALDSVSAAFRLVPLLGVVVIAVQILTYLRGRRLAEGQTNA